MAITTIDINEVMNPSGDPVIPEIKLGVAGDTLSVKDDLDNVDNTLDADKPISTATQTALDLKADKTSISNIDNTSDADKPVSDDTQTALDSKANESDTIKSSTTGEPTGASEINNIVQISQSNYDAAVVAGTTVATTQYIING